MDAAGLGEQADVGDDHVALDGLAHVVDCERRGADRGERLHLDARPPVAADGGGNFDGAARLIQREPKVNAGDLHRMAHRDQLRRALRAHDARHLRDREHVALLHAAGTNEVKRLPVHQYARGGDGLAVRDVLFPDVHHPRAALIVKMCKIRHVSLRSRSCSGPPRSGARGRAARAAPVFPGWRAGTARASPHRPVPGQKIPARCADRASACRPP